MTAVLETEQQEQQAGLKPFKCLNCQRHLGMTNGRTLFIGAVFIKLSVNLHCGECGFLRCWKPCNSLV